jgi:hypothetical protein
MSAITSQSQESDSDPKIPQWSRADSGQIYLCLGSAQIERDLHMKAHQRLLRAALREIVLPMPACAEIVPCHLIRASGNPQLQDRTGKGRNGGLPMGNVKERLSTHVPQEFLRGFWCLISSSTHRMRCLRSCAVEMITGASLTPAELSGAVAMTSGAKSVSVAVFMGFRPF